MRNYECVFILDPTLEEDALGTLSERFRQVVLNQGGNVDNLEKWERRRLAFEIKEKREGIYYLMHFTGNPGVESELQRVMRLTDGVLRHIVVRMDDAALKHLQAQAAVRAQARAQAEAAAPAAVAAPPAAETQAAAASEPKPAPPAEKATPPAEPEKAEPPTTETTEEATEEVVAASEDTESVESEREKES